jgi:serine/threonine protein kinase/Flp pilus assembly protein TadD
MNDARPQDDLSADALVAEATDEFMERLGRGERPEVEAYARRYPQVADVLRRVLPALQLLRSATPEEAAEVALTEPPAAGCLGDFRLLREVGRGGMGVVYEAVQISLNRRVALKVLPFASTLDARQLQRFKNEAQAAALLHHQGIVPVYATGCERGVHYYAMQFIEGQTLAAVIADLRAQAQPGRGGGEQPPARLSEAANRLLTGPWVPAERPAAEDGAAAPGEAAAPASPPAPSTAARAALSTERSIRSPAFFRAAAQLGVQAAEALEHAHQLGVVHRDIKPANLMVDGRGHLWVTDFGLAHCQSQAGLTMTGDLVGTLRYMSPEQALAKRVVVDQRTDIYSLGVTLYELLALEPAFPGSDRQELLRQIAFEEPAPPRRLNKAIPAELETIVLKALEKNPADRYQTAQELADDLRRFLEDRPIRAKRPTLLMRARKLVRRHKPVVVAGMISLAVLLTTALVALAISNVLIQRERDRKDEALGQARANAKVAEAQRQEAENHLKLVLESLDAVYLQEVEKRLAFYQREAQLHLLQDPARDQLERAFLEKGVRFYQKLAERKDISPSARYDMAKAYRRVGAIQLSLRHLDKCEVALHKAIAFLEQLAEEFPEELDYGLELADTYHSLYSPLADSGRLPQAEHVTYEALARFGKLAAKFPGEPRGLLGLIHCHHSLGLVLTKASRAPEAERAYSRALALHAELASAVPREVADARPDLALTYEGLAGLYRQTGRLPEAVKVWRQDLALRENLVADFPADPQYRWHLAVTHMELGHALRQGHRLQEAVGAYRQAIPIWDKLVQEVNTAEYRWRLGCDLGYLGDVLREAGRRREAEGPYRRGLQVYEKLAAEFPTPDCRWHVAHQRLYLGDLFQELGQPEQAVQRYRGALPAWQALVTDFPDNGDYRQHLSTTRSKLAERLLKKGQHAEAAALVADDPNAQNGLAWRLATDPEPRLRDPAQAAALARKAVEAAPKIASYWNTLGTALYRAGDWHGAIEALQKSAGLSRGGLLGFDAFFLAMANWRLGHKERAGRWYAAGLAWMEQYASTNEELRRFRAEAAHLLQQPEGSGGLRAPAPGEDLHLWSLVLEADPGAAWAYQRRGNVYAERGQWDKASADYGKAAANQAADPYPCYLQALVRLHLGDRTGYRKACAGMLERFGKAEKPAATNLAFVVWSSVLAADAVDDYAGPVQLAEKLAAAQPKDLHHLSTLGAALYRAGRFEEAVQRLSQVHASHKPADEGRLGIAYTWCFLAMAHHRLGHAEEARHWLAEALGQTGQAPQQQPPGATGGAPVPWNRRVTLQLLRREAEALTKGTKKNGEK